MPWKLASLLARGRQLDNPPTQEPLQELWLFLKAVCSNRGGQTNYQGNEKDSEKKKKKGNLRKKVVGKESIVEKAFNYWVDQVWMEAGLGEEWIHVYVWMSPFTVHQKLS